MQELELQQSAKKTQEAMALAADESAKCKAAKEVIKSLAAQVMFDFYVYAYFTYTVFVNFFIQVIVII